MNFKITSQPQTQKRSCTLFSDEEDAIKETPAPAENLKQQGTSFAEKGMFKQALQSWNAAAVQTPKDHELYEMQAQVFLELGEDFKAIQAAEKCVGIAPEYLFGLLTLGRAQLNYNMPQMALTTFGRATLLAPDNEELKEEVARTQQIIERLTQPQNNM